MKVTGTVMTGVAAGGKSHKYGTLLDGKTLYAPVHSHFFVARMHMAVDGDGMSGNSVSEVNFKMESKGPHNPHGNAFYAEETRLRTEIAGRRRWEAGSARYWRVLNENERNRTGTNTAWRVMPGKPTPLFARPEATFLRRAGFAAMHLWATPFNPFERYPGGDYPNQNARDGDGLPFWTQQDRSLEDQGIVLWHVFGTTRQVRLEDWPVSSCISVGFQLQPEGFFDRNPSIGPVTSDAATAAAVVVGNTSSGAGAGGSGNTSVPLPLGGAGEAVPGGVVVQAGAIEDVGFLQSKL